VVVRKFNFLCAFFSPYEADAKLVVDADRILTRPVAFQEFKAIAGRGSQIRQSASSVEVLKLPASDLEQIGREALPGFAFENGSGQFVPEALDHQKVCIII
jgi:hypothetical protein